jgi:hypothetical protein
MIGLEDFIYKYEGSQKEILTYFHNLLTIEFGLAAKLTYNLPFYYGKSWICYLFPTKKGTVELTFTRGNELSNEQGILKRKGRKLVSSISFENIKDIPEAIIMEVIHEAVILDETVPYKPQEVYKRTSKK